MHCSSPPDLQPGPVLHAWASHYLTYYVLATPRSRAHQGPGSVRTKRLRANFLKNSIIRSIEQPGPAAPQFGEDFFRSPITSKFASMTSKAHWQHESDLLHSGYIHVFMCRCEHSIISVLTKVAESHDRVTLLQHCCLQTFNSPHSWHRCLLQ